jgi:hypothetical protein
MVQNLSFKAFVAFASGNLHSSPSSTRVIFVAKATHVLNDKFCRKKLDHLLYYTGFPKKEDESITPLFIGRF